MHAVNQTEPQFSPQLFLDVISRFEETATLQAALELDVFTAMAEGNLIVADLAKHCEASERGMRALCDALVVMGFLTKVEKRYALTPDSAMFLDRHSRAYAGAAWRFLSAGECRQGFDSLADAVRRGGTVLAGAGTLEPEDPIWVEFARSMASLRHKPAEFIAELVDAKAGSPIKVLDVAAGHGIYGITIAKRNPSAEITAVDWDNVLEVATENAQLAGVGARHHLLPGSAFDVEFGGGFDIVLLTGFLHHFNIATIEKLLCKVHTALLPGGRTVILEFVPDEERRSSAAAVKFSLRMLALTPAGDAYTFSQYERMLHNAGFSSATLHPVPGSPQHVVIGVK